MIDLLTEIYRTAMSGFFAFMGTYLLLLIPAAVIASVLSLPVRIMRAYRKGP